MRDKRRSYYNEKFDFFALSRYEDVDRCLLDWDTYRSGRGSILELIRADIEIPSGVILFEDPGTSGASPTPTGSTSIARSAGT